MHREYHNDDKKRQAIIIEACLFLFFDCCICHGRFVDKIYMEATLYPL